LLANQRKLTVASLQELLAQKEAIDREIETTQKQARIEAISKVKALMSEYGLTANDLNTKSVSKAGARVGGKVAVKYRDSSTGDTWSGRGLQPKWLKAALAAGKNIRDFAV
jgi:DNA-binding protein H-NS